MIDWDTFCAETPWAVPEELTGRELEPIVREEGFIPSSDFASRYPALSRLLAMARVTEVRSAQASYELFGWTTSSDSSCGWLSPAPSSNPRIDLHSDHRLLLREFGGVQGRWNEPEDSRLLNLNWALTEGQSGEAPDGWYDYYVERCDEAGLQPTISPAEYVAFAVEANGNATLYHRESGRILLFASDHAFDDVSVLEGAPELTLYEINDCPSLVSWVESAAKQWFSYVRGDQPR